MPTAPDKNAPDAAARRRFLDPRLFQIAALGALLTLGLTQLDFNVTWGRAALLISGALITQAAFCAVYRARFDWRSPLITALSLSLLLRTGTPEIAVGATVAAIGSKFLIRINGRHLFNPATFAIVAALLLTDNAWVSPGQWGSEVWLALLVASLGGLVLTSAARLDIALGFLAAYGGLLVARALWLGDPLVIPLHQMQSGALLLFAFFMITDPRTTPLSVRGRLLFALLTAAIAVALQVFFFIPEAIFYALFLAAPATPLIDRLWPGPAHRWPGRSPQGQSSTIKQVPHEKFFPQRAA